MLELALQQALRSLADISSRPRLRPQPDECGRVLDLQGGVARVSGLPNVELNELVRLADGTEGIVIDLDEASVGVMLLQETHVAVTGAIVRRLKAQGEAPVGEALLGRVLDATGRPLDGGPSLSALERAPIEQRAPEITERAAVTRPLATGITVVDALIPIGRGQRELIMGDRQTGKSSVALDTVLNQRGNDVVCVYCAVGQRSSAVARVVAALRAGGALDYTTVVVAGDEATPGLRFITPYAATSMAEHFMRQGRDVVIVYDDLTRHARAYRELSLLLRRPPGREAFPGDIFYVHSRLLERATQLNAAAGGGSLTALPIIETQAQDISAYIPTNLISITDGQIYLCPELFNRGQLPAIDAGKSVSRVGGKTQFAAMRHVAAELRLAYSQFEELESFARFTTRLDPVSRSIVERGTRARTLLQQPEREPLQTSAQVVVLLALNAGLFDLLPIETLADTAAQLKRVFAEQLPTIAEAIDRGDELQPDAVNRVLTLFRNHLSGPVQG